MPKIKSQKIMNVILNKRNSKSIKDNKTILALNNIISNNENEPYINKNIGVKKHYNFFIKGLRTYDGLL